MKTKIIMLAIILSWLPVFGLISGATRAMAQGSHDATQTSEGEASQETPSPWVFAENINISGIVYTQDGQPLENCYVCGRRATSTELGQYVAKTDKNGRFDLNVPKGGYYYVDLFFQGRIFNPRGSSLIDGLNILP